jgi:hypothetical protein
MIRLLKEAKRQIKHQKSCLSSRELEKGRGQFFKVVLEEKFVPTDTA